MVLLDAEPHLCLKQHAIEPNIPLPLTDHRMLRFPQYKNLIRFVLTILLHYAF